MPRSYDDRMASPPEPTFSEDERDELKSFYAEAMEMLGYVNDLPTEAAGFDFTQEVRAVVKGLEDLCAALDAVASDNGISL